MDSYNIIDFDTDILVLILKCETRNSENNISNLQKIFSYSKFIVHVCEVAKPKINKNKFKNLSKKEYYENFNMYKLLKFASEGPYIDNCSKNPTYKWKNLPCIIIKDSSVTKKYESSYNLYLEIMKSLLSAPNSDLFYLCKWNDSCDKYNDIEGNLSIKWSIKPTATQAIMYQPKARDYIYKKILSIDLPLGEFLNYEITNGKLTAVVFVPNLVDFDINLATTNYDYLKLNECSQMAIQQTKKNNINTYAWIVMITIVLLIVVWISFNAINYK